MAGREGDGSYRERLKEITEVLMRSEIVRGITPEKLRRILEDLGPTYIKLGQIMSMRSDMLPKAYCDELVRLRSDVPPMPFEEVKRIVEREYAAPLRDVFSAFDERALGSASIAQVHRATLKTGERVVVKVQREGIYETMSRDIALLHRAVGVLRYTPVAGLVDFNKVLDEMWSVAQQEMNFLTEASNLEEFARLNADVAFVCCPALYKTYTTTHVLVMEYIDGLGVDARESLTGAGYDPAEIGAKLADNYVKQVVDDGFFHADPHPGNLRVREGKIVFIDMGMMGRLTPRDQALIGSIVEGVAVNDVGRIKDAVMSIGDIHGRVDQGRLYADIDELLAKYGSADLGGIDLAQMFEDLMEVMKVHHISMPHGLSMLARGMATLEGVISALSPEINIVSVASGRIAGRMLRNFDFKKELQRASRAVYASARKALDIPALAADVLRQTQRGQTRLNFDMHASDDLRALLLSLADKLVTGLVIAALLLGSSILCTTDMQPRLLGVPLLGVIGYAAALALIVYLGIKEKRHK